MTRGDLPTGTVTFLYTDVAGSTQLLRSTAGRCSRTASTSSGYSLAARADSCGRR